MGPQIEKTSGRGMSIRLIVPALRPRTSSSSFGARMKPPM